MYVIRKPRPQITDGAAHFYSKLTVKNIDMFSKAKELHEFYRIMYVANLEDTIKTT